MTLEKFEKLLGSHDWTYAYSDDYGAFCKGKSQHAVISDYLKSNPQWLPLYKAYSAYYLADVRVTREEFQDRIKEAKRLIEQTN